jgi:hypothetical protein
MRTFTENQVLKIIEHLETKGFNDDCLTYEEELEYILEQPLVKSIEVIYCCKSDSELLCECDEPLIRTSDKGGEYCGSCGKDLD